MKRTLFALCLLVALALAATACGDSEQITATPRDGDTTDTSGATDSAEGDTPATSEPPGSLDPATSGAVDEQDAREADPFLGLSVDDAAALADSQERPWRIGRQDGELFALTDDHVVGRVTFEVDDGIVTGARVEVPIEDAGTTVPPAELDPAEAALVSDAIVRVLTEENTFGGGMPFDIVYVATSMTSTGAALDPLSLEMIAAALQDQVRVEFVTSFEEQVAELMAANDAGDARLPVVASLEALRIDDARAELDVALWCGSLCATWLTYEAEAAGDGWEIVGPIGPIAVS